MPLILSDIFGLYRHIFKNNLLLRDIIKYANYLKFIKIFFNCYILSFLRMLINLVCITPQNLRVC